MSPTKGHRTTAGARLSDGGIRVSGGGAWLAGRRTRLSGSGTALSGRGTRLAGPGIRLAGSGTPLADGARARARARALTLAAIVVAVLALRGGQPGTAAAAAATPPGPRTAQRRYALSARRLDGRPDYIAHIADSGWIPDDRGEGKNPGDWQELQWNFAGPFGVEAPEAWANVAADGAPGGAGVIVAVLDTGVAYANRGPFRRSPDFGRYEFVKGYNFVNHTAYPNDANGHGTFVAGTIAERTDNGLGLTGLAFGVRIMPVKVLNNEGEGYASTIAEGVYYAVRHGAKVINMSLEFGTEVTGRDIPELIKALQYAYRRGVVVVAAAGNEGHEAIAYPARAPHVIAVGATTEHGCLASYSNYGTRLTLVAPGGGADANLPGDPNCHPELPPGRDVFQMTFTGSSPRRFGFPNGYEGTSMAAPQVTATAALIIASHVLGARPTPAQVTARLRATARKLGGPSDAALYGAGLVDAAAATAPGGPDAAAAPPP
jgi:serine protease